MVASDRIGRIEITVVEDDIILKSLSERRLEAGAVLLLWNEVVCLTR